MCVYLHWLSFNIFFQVYIEYVKRTKSFNTFDSPVLVQKLIYWSRREELFLPFFGKQKTRTTLRKIVAYSRFRVARVSPPKKNLENIFFSYSSRNDAHKQVRVIYQHVFPSTKRRFSFDTKKEPKNILMQLFPKMIDWWSRREFFFFFFLFEPEESFSLDPDGEAEWYLFDRNIFHFSIFLFSLGEKKNLTSIFHENTNFEFHPFSNNESSWTKSFFIFFIFCFIFFEMFVWGNT